jgi:hypothetical protein
MNRFSCTKTFVATALALAAALAGSAAHARTDVRLVVAVNTPQGAAQPTSVFVQHRPYGQPAPVYTQPQPVPWGHDRDRFDRNDRRFGPFGDADRDGVPNAYDRDSRFYDARATRRHAQWGDADGDGVANRFDRAPRNPYRR